MRFNFNKKRYLIFFVSAIFILSFFVRLYPSIHRGYFNEATINLLGISKNLALAGEYSTDNDKAVVLSSSRIKGEGVKAQIGNNLTTILYSEIFKTFGFKQEIPFYLSIILFALSSALLFLLVLRMFNLELALIVALLDVFMPFVAQGANKPGYYEFAFVFFFISFLFYFDKKKVSNTRLILAGLFFGLAAVSRNAFTISFLPLIAYDYFKERSLKRIFYLAIPFLIIAGIFLAPDYLSGETEYSFMTVSHRTRFDGHLFPDPYTYYFEKDEFLKDVSLIKEPDNEQFVSQYGVKTPLQYKLYSYYNSFRFYLTRCFALINFGGPLILALIILGAIILHKKRKDLVKFFLGWFGFLYIILIILKTNNWDHFLEIRFPLMLLAGIGAYWIIIKISASLKNPILKCGAAALFLLAIAVHLVGCEKWLFHDLYRNSFMEKAPALSEAIKQAEISDDDVVAVNYLNTAPYYLNYYIDKSFVYFDKETVSRLLRENKLKTGFDFFGVTAMIGSDQDQLAQVKEQTGVRTIHVPFGCQK